METINPSGEALMLLYLSLGTIQRSNRAEVERVFSDTPTASLLPAGLQSLALTQRSHLLQETMYAVIRSKFKKQNQNIAAWEVRNKRIKQQINVSSNICLSHTKPSTPPWSPPPATSSIRFRLEAPEPRARITQRSKYLQHNCL